MESKDIVIIALIVLVVYLYYQQTQSKSLNIQPDNQVIQDLKQQVNHYQTLYQKRVERDLGEEEIIKLKEQKITDLETQLLNLAKQKIKNQKQAKELLNQLESNWKTEKDRWEKRETELNKTIEKKQLTESDIKLLRFVQVNFGYVYDLRVNQVNREGRIITLFSQKLNSELTFQTNLLSFGYRDIIDIFVILLERKDEEINRLWENIKETSKENRIKHEKEINDLKKEISTFKKQHETDLENLKKLQELKKQNE